MVERHRQRHLRLRRQRQHTGLRGLTTPTSSGSRHGTTTRSPTPAAKRSTCATTRPVTSGHQCRPHVAAPLPYRIRHGFGYSVYEHVEDGIASELWIYVDPVDPVKYSVLKLRNLSGVHRRLSATGYVEWILGDLHENTQLHVTTALDPTADLITAQNRYSADFADRVAFFDADPPAGQAPDRLSYTGDRTEFLGRNGSPQDPAGLRNERLSGRLGPALDPCTAIQVPVELDADQQLDVVFRLGVGANHDDAYDVARRSRGTATAQRVLEAVRNHWRRTLDTVHVETPEPAIDAMANGWLLYQTIACRYLARSGYYQSGGAFGFRDQLQDTMAMLRRARPRP